MATWKTPTINSAIKLAGCPGCGHSITIDPTWKLPLLLKCTECGAQWCQISWGTKTSAVKL